MPQFKKMDFLIERCYLSNMGECDTLYIQNFNNSSHEYIGF